MAISVTTSLPEPSRLGMALGAGQARQRPHSLPQGWSTAHLPLEPAGRHAAGARENSLLERARNWPAMQPPGHAAAASAGGRRGDAHSHTSCGSDVRPIPVPSPQSLGRRLAKGIATSAGAVMIARMKRAGSMASASWAVSPAPGKRELTAIACAAACLGATAPERKTASARCLPRGREKCFLPQPLPKRTNLAVGLGHEALLAAMNSGLAQTSSLLEAASRWKAENAPS